MKELRAKPIVKERYNELQTRISEMERPPSLSIIQLGNDPAASYYVQNLAKNGKKIGIEVNILSHSTEMSQRELIEIIYRLNESTLCDGIMLQKPLPKHIEEDAVVKAISPSKDVDGFHLQNLGGLFMEESPFIPCTPAAVLEMLEANNISTNGKHVVIIGRSNIVGKPLANLFLRKNVTGNATVTVCHSRTKDLPSITTQADILIAAIGKANFVSVDMIKENAVVIDVGINEVVDEEGNSRYVGDVDYKACYDKAKAITPVPGGIGSLTTYKLLNNVVIASGINHV